MLVDFDETFGDGVQVIEDGAMLDDNVGMAEFVAMEIAEDGSGIDAAVDAEQGHAHALAIAVRKGPEAAMRIAVLRTDSGMHDEGSIRGDGEDFFLEQLFAASNDEVRFAAADELLHLRRIGGVGNKPLHRIGQ